MENDVISAIPHQSNLQSLRIKNSLRNPRIRKKTKAARRNLGFDMPPIGF